MSFGMLRLMLDSIKLNSSIGIDKMLNPSLDVPLNCNKKPLGRQGSRPKERELGLREEEEEESVSSSTWHPETETLEMRFDP
jgi:hypothetical protein